MRRFLTTALAALTFGGAVAATAAPAEARPHGYHGGYYGHRYYGHHDNDAGVAIAAGVVGLALGAAIASDSGSRGRYYDRGYRYSSDYEPGYGYYDDGYRVCESSRWVWDPYIHRNVMVRSTYRC